MNAAKFKALAIAMLLATTHNALSAEPDARWWTGNTHTHTWWSDGDTPPELVAKWYKEHDYQFLVLTDHNIMQAGTEWYPIDDTRRSVTQIQQAYDEYVRTYGNNWVETRTVAGNREVKLKTLDEFSPLVLLVMLLYLDLLLLQKMNFLKRYSSYLLLTYVQGLL